MGCASPVLISRDPTVKRESLLYLVAMYDAKFEKRNALVALAGARSGVEISLDLTSLQRKAGLEM